MKRSLLVLVLLWVFSGTSHAVTITVNSVDDEDNVDGDCSLREALAAANSNVPVDACVQGSPTEMDIIILPSGTYILSGQLVVSESVRFEGDGPESTIIDADNGSRVFHLSGAQEVEFADLTMTGGNSGNDVGGGIYNDGCTLTLTNCVLTGNAASGSSLGYGGGMYSEQGAVVTLINSTVASNWAYIDGGGLYAHGYSSADGAIGVMTLLNSTVSDNWSDYGYGGAIVGLYGTININTSTVSGNSAPSRGGVVMGYGTLNVNDSTISNNTSSNDGRNIHSINSTVVFSNSIIANRNSGSNCAKNASALWSSSGFNLSDDASCGLNQPSDLNNAEDGLLPLAMNGGPTETHALSYASAAIDAGQCTNPGFDQRGFGRPVDVTIFPNVSDGCDIGSFERQPGVVVTDDGINLVEGGAGDWFSIALDSQPATGAVTITAVPDAECTVDDGSHVFDSTNWDLPWVVTVTAVDDTLLDGQQSCRITNAIASSTDPKYSPSTPVDDVEAEISDNEIGVVVSESDGVTAVGEDGTTDSFTVKLSTQPTSGSVTITIAADAQCDVDTTSHVFDGGNWNDDLTVVVSTMDNAVDDGDRSCVVTHEITVSGAPEYPPAMVISDVFVTVVDDDTAGAAVNESDGSTEITEEGVTDSYEIALASQPSAGSVTVAIGTDVQCSVDMATRVFNAANWSDPVSVTVSNETPDDDVDDLVRTCAITHEITSTDAAEYPLDLVLAGLTVTLTDDDTAGVNISESSGSTVVGEGGPGDTYEIVLNSQPSDGEVMVAITPGPQCVVGLASVIFDDTNWSVPVTITVSTPDNDVDDGDRSCAIAHSITSSGAVEYPSGLTLLGVLATVVDDDTAGVLISESAGHTEVSEDGTTDTYEVVLGSQPSAGNVELVIASDGWCSVTPTDHSFGSTDWSQPLTVTVSTPDNDVNEGNRSCTISHTIVQSDAVEFPTDMLIDDVVATVVDDDTARVDVVESDFYTIVTEDGATDTYDIVLNSQPSAGNVVLVISPGSLCAVSPNAHSFNTANWEVPVTVTVATTVPDNGVIDGERNCVITHDVVASDALEYPTFMPIQGVTVMIVDDENPPVFTNGFESGGTLAWSSAVP